MLNTRHACSQYLAVAALCVIAAGAVAQPLNRETDTPNDRFVFAEGLLVRQFYDLAEKELRYFLDKYPEHDLAAKAMFRLIECLRAQDKVGDTLSAINQFQQRWATDENAPKLFLWKGELLLRQNKVTQAVTCFRRLVLSPDTVIRESALYFLAECYTREDRPDQALQYHRKIAGQPFDGKHLYRPFALFSVAAAAQHDGEFEEAGKAFTRLKDEKHVPPKLREEGIYRLAENHFLQSEYQGAITLYELLLVEYPESAFSREARKRRTWAYFSLQNCAKASELARDWRKRYADVFDFEVDFIQGASLMGLSFFAEALPLFEKLVTDARVPKHYVERSLYQQIYCLLRVERFEDAVAKAVVFTRDFPKSTELADVCYFAGEALYRLKKLAEAVQSLRRGIAAFTGEWDYFADAHFRLTECLESQDKFAEAAAVYRKLSGDARVSGQALALLRAGECERRAGNWEPAVADLENVLKQFPNAADETRAAILHLGELYAEKEQYDRAVTLIKGLLAREGGGNRPQLLFFLGYWYYQQSKYDEAEKHLRLALAEKNSGQIKVNASFFLAGALLEQEKNEEALILFAELLTLPVEKRPAFNTSLLLRLEALFYDRRQYGVSETICRWLLTWEDSDVVYAASLRLVQILLAQSRLVEAQKLLEDLLEKARNGKVGRPGGTTQEEIKSYLGEVLLHRNENDRAVGLFEQCLTRSELSIEHATRCRWGLAHILKEEDRLKQALHYAIRAYILSDHPVYTPKAMFIAIEVLLGQQQPEKAFSVWRELRKRYPSYAEQKRLDTRIKKLEQRFSEP